MRDVTFRNSAAPNTSGGASTAIAPAVAHNTATALFPSVAAPVADRTRNDPVALTPISLDEIHAHIAKLRELVAQVARLPTEPALRRDSILNTQRALSKIDCWFTTFAATRYHALAQASAKQELALAEGRELRALRNFRDVCSELRTALARPSAELPDLISPALAERRALLNRFLSPLMDIAMSSLDVPGAYEAAGRYAKELERINDYAPRRPWSELEALTTELLKDHNGPKRPRK